MSITFTEDQFSTFKQNNTEITHLYGERLIQQMLTAFPIVNAAGSSDIDDFTFYFGPNGQIGNLLKILVNKDNLALALNSGIWERLLAMTQNAQDLVQFNAFLTSSSLSEQFKSTFRQLAQRLFNAPTSSTTPARLFKGNLQLSLEQLPSNVFSSAEPPTLQVVNDFQYYLKTQLTIFHATIKSTYISDSLAENNYVNPYQRLKANSLINNNNLNELKNVCQKSKNMYQSIGANFSFREATLAAARAHTIEYQRIESQRPWLVRFFRHIDFTGWLDTARQKIVIQQRLRIMANIADWSEQEQKAAYHKANRLLTTSIDTPTTNSVLNIRATTSTTLRLDPIRPAANRIVKSQLTIEAEQAALAKLIGAERDAIEQLSLNTNKKLKLAGKLAFGEENILMTPFIRVTLGQGICTKTTGAMTCNDLNNYFCFTPRTATPYSNTSATTILSLRKPVYRNRRLIKDEERTDDPNDRGPFTPTKFTPDDVDLFALNQWLNLRRLHELGILYDPATNQADFSPLPPFIQFIVDNGYLTQLATLPASWFSGNGYQQLQQLMKNSNFCTEANLRFLTNIPDVLLKNSPLVESLYALGNCPRKISLVNKVPSLLCQDFDLTALLALNSAWFDDTNSTLLDFVTSLSDPRQISTILQSLDPTTLNLKLLAYVNLYFSNTAENRPAGLTQAWLENASHQDKLFLTRYTTFFTASKTKPSTPTEFPIVISERTQIINQMLTNLRKEQTVIGNKIAAYQHGSFFSRERIKKSSNEIQDRLTTYTTRQSELSTLIDEAPRLVSFSRL